jgi:trehalose 6-phosphate phosphatase
MEVLNPDIDIDAFFKSLSSAPQNALLLDYDGTLAPFKVERDKAYPYPEIPALLDSISECVSTRIVIISGRAIADLVPLLRSKHIPEIWGSHGWERLLPDGRYDSFRPEPKISEGLRRARDWIIESGYERRSEYKSANVTLHWRGLPQAKITAMRESASQAWAHLADRYGLLLLDFDGGMELRAPGRDKGKAVKKILSEMGQAVVSYLGDDNTDEDAFNELGSKGLSVLVNKNKHPTAADIWLKPPDELTIFLKLWRENCEG